jgi:Protein of unknown function (DUF2950)
MRKTMPKPRSHFGIFFVMALLFGAALAVLAAPPIQRTFPTPEDAWKALLDATAKQDTPAMKAIFGPGCEDLVTSGDPVADKVAQEGFIAAVKEKTTLLKEGKDKVVSIVGNQEWPFPIPIVKAGGAWHFDTAVGMEEIVNRRIGKNELYTIAVCRAYVEAQEEYAKLHKEPHYAQKLVSDEGMRDGLYWNAKAGEPESPFGPHVAHAVIEGYPKPIAGEPTPYHGYYFRVLKAQGTSAPGGARSYVKGEHMTLGFALVAYPASYGASGVMTFIVNKQGIVFEKDLGPKTEEIASAMTEYDPDATWEPVKD